MSVSSQQIAAGLNPTFEKKRAAIAASVNAANTFKAVADEFVAKREREGLKDITTTKARWLLSQLEPALGGRSIAEIEPYELLDVLKRVELSGRHETAKRLLAFAGRVFRYGIATTRAKRNIAADLQGALIAPKVKHHAAIIDPQGVGGLLRAIDGFDGQRAMGNGGHFGGHRSESTPSYLTISNTWEKFSGPGGEPALESGSNAQVGCRK